MTRSCVPKWIKKGEGKVPIGEGTDKDMNFHFRDARKWRPAQNKGRSQGHQEHHKKKRKK